jgi:RimJ/RimL family protein N-acetyltransferase
VAKTSSELGIPAPPPSRLWQDQPMSPTPPAQVTVDDVTVRRWRVEDAAALDEMIRSSLEHLRPWMPWVAYEPLPVAARAELIAAWDRAWDAGDEFTCAIVGADGELLGGCGLHRRIGPGAIEIGYWVRAGRTGRGVATAAVRAIVEMAFAIDGIASVEIHHDAANIASARVAEKAGFARVSERPDAVAAPAEIGIDVGWRLHRPHPPAGG